MVLVWRVLHVGDNPRPVRNGIVLGLLVAYQVFLSEELLFITGLLSFATGLVWLLREIFLATASLKIGPDATPPTKIAT